MTAFRYIAGNLIFIASAVLMYAVAAAIGDVPVSDVGKLNLAILAAGPFAGMIFGALIVIWPAD